MTVQVAPSFLRCGGCTWNPLTDEGTRGCRWLACPRLPDPLDVRCAFCAFNFYTWQGNPTCDPATCTHGDEPRRAARRLRLLRGT